ncbi:nucleoside 2-deoxyribosyltransferase [Marinobacter zhanjiangensis]|uniref:Nucleoside 2-deoxyribosyltransferase n=1 Tax=Marinobacter zhanjiangensis TaxID=578215 RepID=A0ABQ3ASC9_9GAMM|nr:nucleoside 2-deoxyribosyltransferase [Marinobacter zhanjiangensis]GGY65767.1 nucleoside 2-deoxyribosyltransferase [Marinobacter zhanjiangensis]
MPSPQTFAVYLAGPEVFLEEAQRKEIIAEKQRILQNLGMTGLDPMDNELAQPEDAPAMARAQEIYQANVNLLHRCDGALVNLTPFRGPSADAGTVFETGYLAALGKPMMGYTLYPGDYEERVAQPGAAGLDEFGCSVEDFGQVDNLMIESAILSLGGRVIRSARKVREGELAFDREVFRIAATALAEKLRQGPSG